MKYKIINNCQICKNKLIKFLDLGKQPLCDDLTIKPNKSNFYKLQVLYCKKCLTAFQKYNIQKNEIAFLSANTWDVSGGGNYGYNAIWVNRNNNIFDNLDYKPKNEIKNLKQLLDII